MYENCEAFGKIWALALQCVKLQCGHGVKPRKSIFVASAVSCFAGTVCLSRQPKRHNRSWCLPWDAPILLKAHAAGHEETALN